MQQDLSITKQDETDSIQINWVGDGGEINSTYEINAGTDLIENVDGNKYRVVLLRLKNGGTYEVNTGSLTLVKDKSKGVTVAPFEKLELNLDSRRSISKVLGKIKYAETDTTYTLRTYLGSAEGEADYLVDECKVLGFDAISVDIPSDGTLMPTGNYYVTSFLMTEKDFTLEGGTRKNALVAIDSWQSKDKVHYTNTNEPTAPAWAKLEFVGNEVMTAKWDKVDDADGYRVTVYQKDGNEWKDTGFGYDLDENTTSINMALTVGGEETGESKNLSANETYKVGVRAYRTVEKGKY